MVKKLSDRVLMKAAAGASVGTSFVFIFLKTAAFFASGSLAMLSSLFDSVQDMMTSVINFFAVRTGNKPPDAGHKFGHGKAAALGSLIQGVIIVVMSLFLIRESVERFFNPQEIESAALPLFVTTFVIFWTLALSAFQKYVIRRTKNLSIKADRAHYVGDVFLNTGVIISIILSYYFHWTFVDALCGIFVGFYLFYAMYHIIRESLDVLMDTEMPLSFQKGIRQILDSFPEIKSYSDLKTRTSGNRIFVQCNVQMDKTLPLASAHKTIDRIEKAIRKKYKHTDVIIHPEPYGKGK
ncbi:MAG: cation diffusion facilitator family transporter [Lactobacillales bacterium]|jgi:ferrous-iron efflux pump FieF|nr:cation diffusion facilitator family transporter [Lactobacillales bacterium]